MGGHPCHSSKPNSRWLVANEYETEDASLIVYATNDIEVDQEIFISYGQWVRK